MSEVIIIGFGLILILVFMVILQCLWEKKTSIDGTQ